MQVWNTKCKLWQNFDFTIHLSACLLNSNATHKSLYDAWMILYVAQIPTVFKWRMLLNGSYRKCNLDFIARPHGHLPPLDMISLAIWSDKSKRKSKSTRHAIQSPCWSFGFPCPLAALLSLQAADSCSALFGSMISVIINSRMPWLEHATTSHLHLCLSAGLCLAVHSCRGALVRVGSCWIWFLGGCYFQGDFTIPLALVSYGLSLLTVPKADLPEIVLVCHGVSGKDEIQKRRMI